MATEQPEPQANEVNVPGPVEVEPGPVEVVPGQTVLTAPRLGLAMLVAALLAWAGSVYLPAWFTIPAELEMVGADSPAALQQTLAEEEQKAAWKNAMVQFAYVGLCFGAVPLMLTIRSRVRRPVAAAVMGLMVGVVSGVLAFLVGSALRGYLDTGGTIPLVGEEGQNMAGDSLVFILASVMFGLPIAAGILMMSQPQGGQKAVAAPLAGLVAGLLVPIVASFIMPGQNTEDFPPLGAGLWALWLGTFAVLVVVFMSATGTRTPKASPTAEAA